MKRIFIIVFLASLTMMTLGAIPALAEKCCQCTNPNATDSKAIICIESVSDDCTSLKTKSNNADVKKLNCIKPLDPAQCQKISNNGMCASGPHKEISYSIESTTQGTKSVSPTEETKQIEPPTLGITIPGVEFSGNIPVVGGDLKIPWFAQYISAIHKYLFGISVVAAAIMLVYGGVLYIVAASGAKIESGKSILKDSLIGLFIILGAVTILQTINPETIQPKALTITSIRPKIQIIPSQTFQAIQEVALAQKFVPDIEIQERLKDIRGGKLPAERQYPNNPFDSRETLDEEAITKVSELIAEKTGISDLCIIKSIIGIESKGRINALGHDEDVADLSVQWRLDFLRSGKKKSGIDSPSGAVFTPPTDLPSDCTEDVAAECRQVIADTKSIKNDDIITAQPPTFGLDMRFSHGLGLTQITVFPPEKKGGGHCKGSDGSYGVSTKHSGGCWTIPMLLTLEGQVELAIKQLKSIKDSGAKTPCNFFGGWGGKGNINICTGLFAEKTKYYAKCVKSSNKISP